MGVETNVDIVIADPIYESFSIAEKVVKLCSEMGIEKVCTILNKVQSKNTESVMTEELKSRNVKILGVVHYDPEIVKAGLMGTPLDRGEAAEDVRKIVERLEETVS